MDTSGILFICGGAFAGLDRVIRDRSERSGIGFAAEVKTKDETRDLGAILAGVEPDDLVRYGLIPEFVGRLPVVATLEELDEAALISILTEPKNALTKQYAKLFDMEGCELEFRPEALTAVATKAKERKTGARGLRTILEGILLDVMYDLPSQDNATKVVIDEAVINGDARPYIVYENPQADALPEEASA